MKLPALEWYTRIQSAAAVPRMRQPPLTMRPPTAIEVFQISGDRGLRVVLTALGYTGLQLAYSKKDFLQLSRETFPS